MLVKEAIVANPPNSGALQQHLISLLQNCNPIEKTFILVNLFRNKKLVELYKRQMVAAEAIPDGFTYSHLLSAYARSGMLRDEEQVHGRVLAYGYSSIVFVMTNLVNLYAMVGGADGIGYARKVFDEMGERNVVSWNSLALAILGVGMLIRRGEFSTICQRRISVMD